MALRSSWALAVARLPPAVARLMKDEQCLELDILHILVETDDLLRKRIVDFADKAGAKHVMVELITLSSIARGHNKRFAAGLSLEMATAEGDRLKRMRTCGVAGPRIAEPAPRAEI